MVLYIVSQKSKSLFLIGNIIPHLIGAVPVIWTEIGPVALKTKP